MAMAMIRRRRAASTSTTNTNTASDMKAMYSQLRSMATGIASKLGQWVGDMEHDQWANGSSSSSWIRFAASSSIDLFEIEGSDGETSLTDIFNAIHQAGAEILMANIISPEEEDHCHGGQGFKHQC